MAVLTLNKWNISIGDGQPLVVIAGLNVLEDIELARDTARHLKQVTRELGLPYVFKASFDKANRSSIHSYRGPGITEGLKMLKRILEQAQTLLHGCDGMSAKRLEQVLSNTRILIDKNSQ